MVRRNLPWAIFRWESDEKLAEALKACIGYLFNNNNRSIVEIYDNYKEVSTYIYNRDVAEALGEPSNEKSKPKMK